MRCAIKWNTQSIEDWEEKFSRIPRSNILQSYTYAIASAPLKKQAARHGLIEIDGREAGLVQLFEKKLLCFHAIVVDRGPLWFEGFGNAMHVKCFFDELNRQFPQRWGRTRDILPETEDGPTAQKMIAQTGLARADAGHNTLWLNLAQDNAPLARDIPLSIEWDETGKYLAELADHHAEADLLRRYGPLLAAKGDLLMGRTTQDGQPLALVLFARHGRSATCLALWSSKEGQACGAYHWLLREGASVLKQKGIKELDLGRISNDGANGIEDIKKDWGGRHFRSVGRYR